MKFNPKTHQTRCGAPWRDLEIKGQDVIAVKIEEGKEDIFIIQEDGRASHYRALVPYANSAYDLIPVKREHDLPKGIAKKWKYAAKDYSLAVYLYTEEPEMRSKSWITFKHKIEITELYPDALKNIPWDSGYFKRVGDTDEWGFVEVS